MKEGPLTGYTVRETAASLRVNAETVRRWIRKGLPAINVGSKTRPDYRIKPDVLERWLQERQDDAATE